MDEAEARRSVRLHAEKDGRQSGKLPTEVGLVLVETRHMSQGRCKTQLAMQMGKCPRICSQYRSFAGNVRMWGGKVVYAGRVCVSTSLMVADEGFFFTYMSWGMQGDFISQLRDFFLEMSRFVSSILVNFFVCSIIFNSRNIK